MMKRKSPYLVDPDRLADVIAALQATATYKFYKLNFREWADRISGDEDLADHWRQVMEEHPEFFRLDSKREKASLVWRRQHQKLYNVDTETNISRQEYNELKDSQKERISRTPLETSEISTLISTAINLHSRAIEQKRELRWWIPLIAAFVGTILGALIASLPNWAEQLHSNSAKQITCVKHSNQSMHSTTNSTNLLAQGSQCGG